MSAIRQPGKVNEDTMLIDIGMQDICGMTAVYLVQGERKCLIDSGTRLQASRLVKKLDELGAFPPDLIIVTHPHWDHIQGIPFLRREAARRGKKIEVLASVEAVPLMAEPSFNAIFNRGPDESIKEVTPLREGDIVDLGDLSLQIYDTPGHCTGHIAIYDEKNHNLFVGDAIGDKFSDSLILPNFMPPTWDTEAFLSSVAKLRQIPYESLSLAHFGYIHGSEARDILDVSLETYHTWWQFYEENEEQLSDTDYLLKAMRREINPEIPLIRPMTFILKVMFPLVSAAGSLTGRRTAIIDKLVLHDLLAWLAAGYRIYKSSHETANK